jgi:aminoglycoside phosphotransferase (APT) family kinase protein
LVRRPGGEGARLEGENATFDRISDLREAAADLAEFISALQRIDPTGGPRPGPTERGVLLAVRDDYTRTAIAALNGVVDTDAVTAAWNAALEAQAWQRSAVWIHGDLSSGNLLVVRGRLSAVIDFGALNVGDPACDLGSGAGLGADPPPLLPRHQPRDRGQRPAHDRRSPRRSGNGRRSSVECPLTASRP